MHIGWRQPAGRTGRDVAVMRLAVSEVGVISDDLTGACDVAGCFVPATGAVLVCITPDAYLPSFRGLTVLNCQSRSLSPQESRSVAFAAGTRLANRRVIFKKIDTAFRGPVGAELEGLLEAVGDRTVIVAPAIPRIGRTTRGGIQYVAGVPIDETDFAKDPSWRIESADVLGNIRRTGSVPCQVCDAETEDDLKRIVEQSLRAPLLVFVGSLGLADALATRIDPVPEGPRPLPLSGKPLIVSGSQYQRSQVQIEMASRALGVRVIDVHPWEMSEITWNSRGDPLIVRIAPGMVEAERLSPEVVMQRFSIQVASLIERERPDALGVIGGETAFHLLRRLGAIRLWVHGLFADVVSFGAVIGGCMDGLAFMLKGGSVGSVDAVARMLEVFMRGERRTNP